MMKKNSIKGYVVLGILFVLVSVIAFAVPSEKTATFWIAYGFTVIAFAAQIAIWKITLGKSGMLKSKFLGFSVVAVGAIYLILQIVSFLLFKFVSSLPSWSVVIVCTFIAGISASCMISGEIAGDGIKRVEEKVQKKVFLIRELQVDIDMLAERESDAEIKSALLQLAEKVRFSDPMSSEQLSDLENEILTKVNELKSAIKKHEIIKEINSLLDERNKKCKILK